MTTVTPSPEYRARRLSDLFAKHTTTVVCCGVSHQTASANGAGLARRWV